MIAHVVGAELVARQDSVSISENRRIPEKAISTATLSEHCGADNNFVYSTPDD